MNQLLSERRGARAEEFTERDDTGMLAPLRELFLNELHIEMPAPETDLLRTSVMDSLMLVELLVAIEGRFGLRVELAELSLDEIRSPRAIAELIARRLGSPPLHLER
jgi:acyl carrier protein